MQKRFRKNVPDPQYKLVYKPDMEWPRKIYFDIDNNGILTTEFKKQTKKAK